MKTIKQVELYELNLLRNGNLDLLKIIVGAPMVVKIIRAFMDESKEIRTIKIPSRKQLKKAQFREHIYNQVKAKLAGKLDKTFREIGEANQQLPGWKMKQIYELENAKRKKQKKWGRKAVAARMLEKRIEVENEFEDLYKHKPRQRSIKSAFK